ncbi:MAG: 2-C-methyl-D-erythritol 2,4-cyclodiphosphate synthase [Firmicutes bacterium]|nr:2-C-methyl-D-erythritol 2,4-cyclodiphosphate synthase [Bacillota bacterium]MDY2921172.1 2-C-methyl-D-erythritol 2,4-cyclodiphosphate synthase [Lentihominibacter sp.]
MYGNRKTAVIVAAAGRGRRMGSSLPKQFLKIGGEPVLVKTLKVFQKMDAVDYIFVVTGGEYVDFVREMAENAGITKVESVIEGGEERQDSVFNALQEINRKKPGTSYVLVHDGARPFVTEQTVMDVIEAVDRKGAAVACVSMKDSIRKTTDDRMGSIGVDRDEYFSVQTPQGFRKAVLIEAYEKAYDDSFRGTDDASLVERAGYPVEIVRGEYGNIKITTKEDLPMENRIGTGFDVHAFEEGRRLVLGGVEIPYNRGLKGHSDADVLIHALMDALLGAAGLGDIGEHFPDSDPAYKGISSMVLLEKVKELLDESLYMVANADITLIAQKPKIGPYKEQMRDNIARVLGVDRDRINVKGTTTEGLGFTGREEGIACEAVASIYR